MDRLLLLLADRVFEINKHSDLMVDVGYRKTGRRVTHVQFQFAPKREKKAVRKKGDPKKYTAKDLKQTPSLAKRGESYEQALARLNQQ